jgi:hypothetical protein
MDCAAVCGSVWHCERQFVAAVHTVVCAQWAQQCAAERLVVVCSSARGSVRLSGSAVVYGSLRRCAAVCGNVCAAVCGSSVRQCGSVQCAAAVYGSAAVCGSVRRCAAVCGNVCAAVCGSVRQQCVAVRQCVAMRAAVCGNALGSAHGSVWQCALHVYTAQVRSQHMSVCSHR